MKTFNIHKPDNKVVVIKLPDNWELIKYYESANILKFESSTGIIATLSLAKDFRTVAVSKQGVSPNSKEIDFIISRFFENGQVIKRKEGRFASVIHLSANEK